MWVPNNHQYPQFLVSICHTETEVLNHLNSSVNILFLKIYIKKVPFPELFMHSVIF